MAVCGVFIDTVTYGSIVNCCMHDLVCPYGGNGLICLKLLWRKSALLKDIRMNCYVPMLVHDVKWSYADRYPGLIVCWGSWCVIADDVVDCNGVRLECRMHGHHCGMSRWRAPKCTLSIQFMWNMILLQRQWYTADVAEVPGYRSFGILWILKRSVTRSFGKVRKAHKGRVDSIRRIKKRCGGVSWKSTR